MTIGGDVYDQLAERIGQGHSKFIADIWRLMVTPEQAEVLLALPGTAEEVAERVGISAERAAELLKQAFKLAVAVPRVREGKEVYRLMRHWGEFYEAAHTAVSQIGEPLADLWRKWRLTEGWAEHRASELKSPPPDRVLPHLDAVADPSVLVPVEDLAAVVRDARLIAIVDCPCRLIMRRCSHTVETCFQFDRAAEVVLQRGSGRELGREEALDLMRALAREGLIAQVGNSPRMLNICFCCADCCVVYEPLIAYGYQMAVPSRFQCVVEADRCTGCQDCVERCPFGAMSVQPVAGSKRLKAVVEAEKCYGCGVCVFSCEEEALALHVVRGPEHIPSTGAGGFI
ncbi:MAG: 4Fe-4S dicluster domain-containing protein [Dehalococcoidia bacterium]